MVNNVRHNQNLCHCAHCRDLPVRVFGGGAAGDGQLSEKADSYLMRAVLRDVSLQKHPARLSVRWVQTGSYTYEVAGENHVLKPGTFLIINDGQFYNSSSDRREFSECFNVSFNQRIFTTVFDALANSAEWLLDIVTAFIAATFTGQVFSQQKTKITKADELPRRTVQLNGKALEILEDTAQLARLNDELIKNFQGDLEKFEIQDSSTLQSYYLTLMNFYAAKNDYDKALTYPANLKASLPAS